MANINGTNVAAKIVPFTTEDQFATHVSTYGQGGWHEVANNTERDNIPADRRLAGMAVFVNSDKKLYTLDADLTTWTLVESGKVDDIQINGTSIVDNKVANITVEDNITSTSTTNPLSANMGKYLQEEIEALSGRGRYLTLWNCATGLAETNPPESPYKYRTGDYFIVGTVASAGGTNYRPDGSSYTTGVASTTVETDEVSIDDTYIYDGSTWHLQYNSQKTVTFTNIAGSPYDNTNLANALNAKQDVLTAGTNITIAEDAQTGDLVISSTSYESLFKGKYNTWNDVPTVGANYPLYIDDGVHTHEPTYTDYMIVVDASTVPGGQVPIVITFRINAYGQQGSVKTNIDGTEYNGYGSFDGKVQVRTDVSTGNYGTQFVVLGEDIEYQGTTYHQGEVFLQIIHNRVVYGQEYTYNAQLSLGYPYEGTWRFSYRGVWSTDNRNGWKGEYPIEQELPIATDSVAGIMKLYTTTGSNIDGTITQASITEGLNSKINATDTISNAEIDEMWS